MSREKFITIKKTRNPESVQIKLNCKAKYTK